MPWLTLKEKQKQKRDVNTVFLMVTNGRTFKKDHLVIQDDIHGFLVNSLGGRSQKNGHKRQKQCIKKVLVAIEAYTQFTYSMAYI